ncbi:hypothetical protein [Flagellimonas crocea]|uniref:hypothetical protein n=1 Tax=Flagellimonas crocea TaxID=3067311 RepID=UPI00296F538B|nr:hypothetical protein [Muricauda sp. DH64]
MPKFDLLLLPLVGGYLFLITFTLTKFYHQRIERQRLIFNSIIAGFFISILGFAIDGLILKSSCIITFRKWLADLNPIGYSGLNYSILIFLISYPCAKLFNRIVPKKTALTFVVERWGNQMEWLFWKSLNHKDDAEKLLMLTTKSNKVYVAYVNKISEPIGDPFVTLIPNFSGYRNKETHEFIITTDYLDVLEKFVEDDKTAEIDTNLGITIPISEILMVSKFNMSVFSDFNGEENSEDDGKEEMEFI